jgi:L-fuculose-phosphate aldolase
MNTVLSEQSNPDYRRDLTNGISILERLGIIDFNGHFSVRLDDGNILINTGSSVRSAISPDQLVVVGPNGETDESAPAPPKELALHLAIYHARPDVRSVAHGHPKWSVLLSSAGMGYQVTFAQGALLGDVPRFDSPRSVNNPDIAKEVAEVLGSGHAALLKSHGIVVAAENILQTTVLAIYLEMNAERQVRGYSLGNPYIFSPEEAAACQKGLWKQGLFEKCWNYYRAKFSLSDRA